MDLEREDYDDEPAVGRRSRPLSLAVVGLALFLSCVALLPVAIIAYVALLGVVRR